MTEHEHEPCNVCGTTDEPTWEAGGVWWCDGCAHWQTDHSAGLDDDNDDDAMA